MHLLAFLYHSDQQLSAGVSSSLSGGQVGKGHLGSLAGQLASPLAAEAATAAWRNAHAADGCSRVAGICTYLDAAANQVALSLWAGAVFPRKVRGGTFPRGTKSAEPPSLVAVLYSCFNQCFCCSCSCAVAATAVDQQVSAFRGLPVTAGQR